MWEKSLAADENLKMFGLFLVEKLNLVFWGGNKGVGEALEAKKLESSSNKLNIFLQIGFLLNEGQALCCYVKLFLPTIFVTGDIFLCLYWALMVSLILIGDNRVQVKLLPGCGRGGESAAL